MYRYGDGTPFPLDENFIETLTAAVETCTSAFLPLAELDTRRERASEARRDGEREIGRLEDLERAIQAALTPYLPGDNKKPGNAAQSAAAKIQTTSRSAIVDARGAVDGRIRQLEAQAAGRNSADAILKALRPFFDAHQLPKTVWIMSWDVRGAEPSAHGVATAGRLTAAFTLAPDPYRGPVRVDQVAEGVVVHMMKKGVFGKAKPAPIDLGKYLMVSFERTVNEQVVTLKESATKNATGLRFAVSSAGATWVSINPSGDAEGDSNPLDSEDVAPVRMLAERANAMLANLVDKRTLVDLMLDGKPLADLQEPRMVPFELLQQLTPLARSIRDRSRMSGELVLKRDIGGNRREELFVPRATLAQQFAGLPPEYRRPFEEMGISGEETQPAIVLPRPPGPARAGRDDRTVEIDENGD